jgi:hypothetical protein
VEDFLIFEERLEKYADLFLPKITRAPRPTLLVESNSVEVLQNTAVSVAKHGDQCSNLPAVR